MTSTSCPPSARSLAWGAAAFALGALFGCAQSPAPSQPPAAAPAAAIAAPPPPAPSPPQAPAAVAPAPAPVAAATPPPPAPAPAPPPVLPFDQALLNAATSLLKSAQLPPGGPYPLVIDPLIDGLSGVQTIATRSMGLRIVDLIQKDYPRYDVQRFSAASLQKGPLVLIGTFTGVNDKRQTSGLREAYRICLALADLKTGKLVSKGLAFAEMKGVDATPIAYFRDAPAWSDDPSTLGYIRTCQGTKPGDPINPHYVDRILVASMISEAIDAYGAGRYRDSLEMFRAAESTPHGKQLRVYNGLYLAYWKLGRRDDMTRAFGDVVDFGVEQKRLATKFLFAPGSTSFVTDPTVSAVYPMWIREIAQRTGKRSACLEISGHTSPTGPEPLNERLSLMRAEQVKLRLQQADPGIAKRTFVHGAGSRETLVGTGRDDATDALDRRVEFKVIGC